MIGKISFSKGRVHKYEKKKGVIPAQKVNHS